MDENEVFGCFYLKQTSNGNLIGEFTNNHLKGVSTESADLKEKKGSYKYEGDYFSTWQEWGKGVIMDLNISIKLDTHNKVYTLVWTKKEKPVYKGEGILCDDILIGNYLYVGNM